MVIVLLTVVGCRSHRSSSFSKDVSPVIAHYEAVDATLPNAIELLNSKLSNTGWRCIARGHQPVVRVEGVITQSTAVQRCISVFISKNTETPETSRRVTLSLTDQSAWNLARYIAEVTGWRARIEGRLIMIESKTPERGVCREFSVERRPTEWCTTFPSETIRTVAGEYAVVETMDNPSTIVCVTTTEGIRAVEELMREQR